MGLLTGQMGYTALKLVPGIDKVDQDKLLRQLTEYRFEKGNKVSSPDLTAGFTTIMSPLDTEFVHERVYFTNFLCFSYREDAKKIPSGTFKVYLMEELERYKDQLNKARITKQERDMVKEDLHARLMKQAIPDIKIFDVLWFFEKNELLFFSTSKALIQRFHKVFKLAFDQDIKPMDHFSLVEECDLREGELSQLLAAPPFELFGGGGPGFDEDEEDFEPDAEGASE